MNARQSDSNDPGAATADHRSEPHFGGREMAREHDVLRREFELMTGLVAHAEAIEAQFVHGYVSSAPKLVKVKAGIATTRIGGGVALSMRHDVTGSDRQNWTWRQATEPDEDDRAHDTAPRQEAPKDFTNVIVDVDAF